MRIERPEKVCDKAYSSSESTTSGKWHDLVGAVWERTQ